MILFRNSPRFVKKVEDVLELGTNRSGQGHHRRRGWGDVGVLIFSQAMQPKEVAATKTEAFRKTPFQFLKQSDEKIADSTAKMKNRKVPRNGSGKIDPSLR